jgi:hypothetical protein
MILVLSDILHIRSYVTIVARRHVGANMAGGRYNEPLPEEYVVLYRNHGEALKRGHLVTAYFLTYLRTSCGSHGRAHGEADQSYHLAYSISAHTHTHYIPGRYCTLGQYQSIPLQIRLSMYSLQMAASLYNCWAWGPKSSYLTEYYHL